MNKHDFITVTTVPTTTYSTSTTTTAKPLKKMCVSCTLRDAAFIPIHNIYPPVKMNSFIECRELCDWMGIEKCSAYNFYTEEFVGNLKNVCVPIQQNAGEEDFRVEMLGVISAGVYEIPLWIG